MNVTGPKSSHRKQQIWVYVITGLFVCDFVLCGYLPSRQRLVSLQRIQARQHRTIATAAGQSAELAGLEQRLRAMETTVERFDRRVPSERALGTFLQQIAGIMKDCGLVDQVVLPGKERRTGAVHGFPIDVACRGSLADIFAFFTRLQALDRLVRIERVVLENDTDLTGQISLRMEAVIFEQLPDRRSGQYLTSETAWRGAANHEIPHPEEIHTSRSQDPGRSRTGHVAQPPPAVSWAFLSRGRLSYILGFVPAGGGHHGA